MAGPGIFKVGDKVATTNFGEGVVRWIGTNPKFKEGDWIGVELPQPTGRNDGSVQGVRYFQCPPLHGVMVKHKGGATLVERDGISVIRPASQVNTHPPSTYTDMITSAPMSRPVSQAAARPPVARASSTTHSPISPPRAAGVARLTRAKPSTSTLSIAAPITSQPIASGSTTPTVASSMEASRNAEEAENAVLSPAFSSPATSLNDTPTPAQRVFVPRHGRKPSAPLVPSRRGESVTTAGREKAPGIPHLDLQRTISATSATSHRSDFSSAAGQRAHGDEVAISRHDAIAAEGDAARVRPASAMSQESNEAGPPDVFGARGAGRVVVRKPSQQSLTGSEHSAATDQSATVRRDVGFLGPDARIQAQQRMREAGELRAKVKMLEKRRAEDAERIRSLEDLNAQQPAGLADLREKMSARFRELNREVADLRRRLKTQEAGEATFENRETELNDQLEMLTLDKEVAEEKANGIEAELKELKEECALLQDEVTILKQENALYERPVEPGTERSSVAYVQLEKHNERLKAALAIRNEQFMDVDKEGKRLALEVERESVTNEGLSNRLLDATNRLEMYETTIAELKEQLDSALGAEEMLEQLTERTLTMSEKIEEMRITIEDLQALKDLSDELEESRAEAEKQQREELDETSFQLQEEIIRVASLQEAVLDREMTIDQFRGLVATLEEQIEDLQAAEADQQNRTAALSNHSQTVLSRNLQPQTSRVKEQERMIDIELARLEARQANDHLGILRAFTPATYGEADASATDAMLFLLRIARKAEVVLIAFCHIYHLPDALLDVKDDKLVGVCELRANISEMASYVKRSASVMQRTTPEEYLNLASAVPEMRGIEMTLDSWLEALKQDGFSDTQCAADLAEIVPRVKHFVERVFIREDLDIGERHLGLAIAFDCDLDSFAAAVGFARVAASAYAADEDTVVVAAEGLSMEEAILQPVQRILEQVRGVKASSLKLHEYMTVVQTQGACLKMDAYNRLRMLKSKVEEATDLAFRLAGDTRTFFEDLRETGLPLRIGELLDLLKSVVSSIPGSPDMDPWDLIGAFVTRLGTDIQQLLPNIREAIDVGNLDQYTGVPPWILRSQIVRSEIATNAGAEAKVVEQAGEIFELIKQVKLRDQVLEEANVRAEVQRRKAEEVVKQFEVLNSVRRDLETANKTGQSLRESLERLQLERELLDRENARLMLAVPADEKSTLDFGMTGTTDGGRAFAQIESLKSAVRYLRHENTRLKAQDLLGDLRSLPHLEQRASTPDLIRSSPGSPSTSSHDTPATPPAFSYSSGGMQPVVERKMLWRELAHFQASAEVVDLTKIVVGKKWRPIKSLPEAQLREREQEEKRLRRRARAFVQRSSEDHKL